MSAPRRACLAFLADGTQCRADASHLARSSDGFSWYACPDHAVLNAEHVGHFAATLIPIAKWWEYVREATPGAPE
jgi:hypothetical protein